MVYLSNNKRLVNNTLENIGPDTGPFLPLSLLKYIPWSSLLIAMISAVVSLQGVLL